MTENKNQNIDGRIGNTQKQIIKGLFRNGAAKNKRQAALHGIRDKSSGETSYGYESLERLQKRGLVEWEHEKGSNYSNVHLTHDGMRAAWQFVDTDDDWHPEELVEE